MTTVAYLGPAGTYTEAAAISFLKLRGWPQDYVHLQPYATISKAMAAVATGESLVAVVPVENSIQGSVTMTLDSLWQWEQLQIQQALVLPIRHALITQAPEKAAIKTVYSHPQALAQCQNWVGENLPQVQQIPAHSTADGLRLVAEDGTGTAAAIASQRAAAMYNLPIMACPINDYPDNYTRFLVLSLDRSANTGTNQTKQSELTGDSGDLDQVNNDLSKQDPIANNEHISLAFSVKANMPGVLVRPLSVFANRNINLSRIESRPTKKSLGDYIFFADIEASIAEKHVQEAIAELESLCETLKIFGSYGIEKVAIDNIEDI
ncbi:Prephenate dehydratase [Thalassoporum mexicanum PCC 7367]|uniref:prephenate dehydratase n=1 Tax=Thalassoporum mexicanum TaxID=3457544 RepID=UPI00029FED8B|nr:prephenate dehydratase [Pseudanabaena sp. PCC 7367]AFY70715.1 Prephenate dehydratase [Pseudanabaena sp. PCC 7367]